ncbi:MAG: hypothetical protein EXR93_05000 [Gemmatimonadetes bacterium]|nr:hypothetical protein [Gemmatimonadota bacterium]
MSTRSSLMGLLVGVVAAGIWTARTVGPVEAEQRGDFTWKGRLAKGKTIEIRGIRGAMRAELATGPDVEVSAIKTARRSDPEEVRIEVVEHEGGATICAIYPARRGKPDNECRPGGGGDNSSENNDVEVRFSIKVPAGVRFAGTTVLGDVTARDLKSDLELRTVNGGIDGTTTGYAEATTVNGSIDLVMGSAGWPRHLEYRTVNGGITIQVPDGIKADVEAQTVNGDIESDFPLTVSGRFGPRKLSGTIAGGGPLLSMRTVNGSIELRRAP